jgi:uncharacterized repeat protein (TIGR01451 family)
MMGIFTVSRQNGRLLYVLVVVSLLLGMVGPAQVLAAPQALTPDLAPEAANTVTEDGTAHFVTGDAYSNSVSITHTTGTGKNRLMLVGVSWNTNSTDRDISSVTFSYGSTVLPFSLVLKQKAGTNLRYAAIYSLLDPPAGQAGTVKVTFPGYVMSGIVAGVTNFQGVNQDSPLGTATGAYGTSSANPSVTLTGLTGNELVFDDVYNGNAGGVTMTVGAGQTQEWNTTIANALAGASFKQASSSSVTMTWTPTTKATWTMVAVPIKPVPDSTPYIYVSPKSLSGFSTSQGTPSAYQSYSVWGASLAADISVTAPTGFEIATSSGGPYSFSLTLPQTGGSVDTTVYVRLTGSALGNPSGNITHTSGTATARNVAVSGTVVGSTIVKAVDLATAKPGDTLSYTLNNITYTGSDLLTNVSVADSVPAGVVYVADSDTPEATVTPADDSTATSLLWSIGSNTAGTLGSVSGDSITVSGAATSSSGTGTLTFSHSTGSGTNRLLVVGVAYSSSATGPTITSVTFNGTSNYLINAGTLIANGTTRRIEIFYMVNPPLSTTGNVVVTFPTGISSAVAGAVTFAGVNQTAPIRTFTSNTGSDAAPTVNVATSAGDLVFDTVVVGNATLTPDGSQSSLWNVLQSANIRGAASTKAATTSSTTMSWTAGSSQTWAIGAVAIEPVPIRTTTLSTFGTLTTTGVPFTLRARVTNTGADTTITPGTLTPTTSGGVTGVSCTGPSPASGSIGAAGGSLDFTWSCTPTATGIGSVALSLSGATGTSYSYPSATSNTVLVVPALTFQATVKSPPGVGQIDNTANLQDTSAVIGTKSSNTATTTVRPQLTVNAGTGGTITAPATSPSTYNYGESVTITASPNVGYHFVNWTGDVGTVADVNAASTAITMNGNYAITANFAINTYALTVTRAGAGSGRVWSAPGGIDCGETCESFFDCFTEVTLTADAAEGSTFAGWSGGGCSGTGTCIVTMTEARGVTATFVVATGEPPVVSDIPDQTILEGGSFATINLDDYVSDPDNTDAEMTWTYSGNSALTVSIVDRVATISTPNADWSGAETITFRATDPSFLWDEDSATFTVTAVNDPPVVTDIPDQTIAEGGSFATINLDNYVSDVDNTDAQMTWTYSGNTNLGVSIVGRVATISTPNADWNGAETITFRVTDPGLLWNEDSATFTVTAVNDPPVVTDIPDQTIAEGGSFATINLDDYVSDVDNTDAEMTWSYTGNSALTVSIVDRVATISTPNADWNGAETITFRATDTGTLWDEDSATFTVTAVNDPPVVTDIPDQTIAEGGSFATINLDNYVSDVDNTDAQMTWTYSGNTNLGVSIVNRVATIINTNPDWNGSETVTFKATDPDGLFSSDSAAFTVTPVNDAPVVTDIPDQSILLEGSFATINLDDHVSDVDNTDAEMTWTYTGNTDLTVNIVDGVATISTPSSSWTGTETITFRATDPGALWSQDAATFKVNVPIITVSKPALIFTSSVGVPSAEQSYMVSGSYLVGDITITAPADFQVSTTSGSGWGSSIPLTPVGGTVDPTTIYVHFLRSTVGASSGNIAHTSTGATEKEVAVTGTAIGSTIVKSVDKATALPGDTLNYTIDGISYTGSDLLTDVSIVDSIPAGASYVADSDTPEATVTPADDDTATLLTWDIGSNTAGTPGSLGGAGTVSLDGTPDAQIFTSTDSVNLSHTTGTGDNRLMLVGVSFNCSTTSPLPTIDKVMFTPGSGLALPLTLVGSKDAGSSRVAAIYQLSPANNPPGGTAGIVAVTFLGSTACTTGVVVGAANFKGVDQANPLGTVASNSSTSTQSISVNVTTTGNELVFDTVETGYQSDPGLTMNSSQTNLWNKFVTGKNTSGGASTKAAESGTTTMNWTRTAAAGYMALVAVPIKPATTSVRTTTLSTYGTLASSGGSFTLKATLTNTAADTNVTPGTLTPSYSGGATGVTCGSPTPASGSIAADGSLDFWWTCTPTATDIGSVALTLSGATGTGYTYPSGTSNTVLVVPALTFQVKVKDPPGVGQIDNTASLKDNGATIGTKDSNTATTLIRPQLTVNAGANGTIAVPATSPSTYNYGEVVAIIASPNVGYHFVNWTGDVSTVADVNAALTTIAMNGNYVIAANFVINTYTLTYNAGTHGSISGTTPQTVDYDADGSEVTAAPNPGYHFTSWSDGVLTASRTDTHVKADKTVTANFAMDEAYALGLVQAGTTLTGDLTALTATFPDEIPQVLVDLPYTINSRMTLGTALPAGSTVSILITVNGAGPYPYVTNASIPASPFWVTELFVPAAAAADFDAGYGGRIELYSITINSGGGNPEAIDTTVKVESVISKDSFATETVLADITLPIHVAADEAAALAYVQAGTSLTGDLAALTATFPTSIPAVLVAEPYTINSRMTLGTALPAGSTVSILITVNGAGPYPYVTNAPIPASPFWVTELFVPAAAAADFDAGYGGRIELYSITINSGGGNPEAIDTTVKIESIISKDGFATNVVLDAITLPLIVVSAPAVASTTPLSWDPVPGATGYRVYQSTAPYFMPSPPHVQEGSSQTYTFPLPITTNYYCIVRAYNGTVESADSNQVGRFTFTLVPGQ